MPGQILLRRKLSQIATGAKDFTVIADDYGPDLGVLITVKHGLEQIKKHLLVQSISGLGPVQDNPAHMVIDLKQKRFIFRVIVHSCPPQNIVNSNQLSVNSLADYLLLFIVVFLCK
jgi:hypothetical protein